MSTTRLRPIDPLQQVGDGTYRDDLVEVHARADRGRKLLGSVRTPHFDLTLRTDLVHVEHTLTPAQVDDDLAGLLSRELFGPGWLRGPELFERIFTGVVLSTAASPLVAWDAFYRNTLGRIEELAAPGGPAGAVSGGGHGTVGEYAPVYAHTADLLAPGDVLELGCCFGFLSLRLAARGRQVVATDLSPGTVSLLRQVAPRLGLALDTLVADATSVSTHAVGADNVLAIHLLEHLDPDQGAQVVAESVRLARRRVVVAVPLEDEAEETWGHVRTVTLDDLRDLGDRSGWTYDVHEHHGGWLVLDHP